MRTVVRPVNLIATVCLASCSASPIIYSRWDPAANTFEVHRVLEDGSSPTLIVSNVSAVCGVAADNRVVFTRKNAAGRNSVYVAAKDGTRETFLIDVPANHECDAVTPSDVIVFHVKSTVEGTPAGFTVRHPYGIRLVQPTTLISYGGGDGDHLFMGAVPGRVVIGSSTVYSGVYAYKAMDDVGTNALELDSGIEPSVLSTSPRTTT